MEMLTTLIEGQPWYMTVVEIVGFANMISMWVNDRWADKYPIIKQINMGLNWLSMNIFMNKNQ